MSRAERAGIDDVAADQLDARLQGFAVLDGCNVHEELDRRSTHAVSVEEARSDIGAEDALCVLLWQTLNELVKADLETRLQSARGA